MAIFKSVLLAVTLLVATSSAAPKGKKASITIPEECKGKGFCSIKPDGYDEVIGNKIKNLLPHKIIDVGDRSGYPTEPISDDDDNCPSKVTKESVYVYDPPDNPTEMDIIVQTKLFSQTLIKVTCANNERTQRSIKEGAPECFRNLGLSHFNMKSTCQESTATRTLLVYDPEVDLIKSMSETKNTA